ncbi:hypothetical protein B0O99DRAFT_626696, partial [Bisporella sp. PMI_857]
MNSSCETRPRLGKGHADQNIAFLSSLCDVKTTKVRLSEYLFKVYRHLSIQYNDLSILYSLLRQSIVPKLLIGAAQQRNPPNKFWFIPRRCLRIKYWIDWHTRQNKPNSTLSFNCFLEESDKGQNSAYTFSVVGGCSIESHCCGICGPWAFM